MSILSLPIVVVVGSMALAIAGLYLGIRIAGILFGFIGNIIQFVVHEVRDAVLFAATIIRAVFTLPRVLLSVVLGRWSAARHHGQTIEVEVVRAGRLLYQLAIGNLMEALGVEGKVIIAMDADGGVISDLKEIEELDELTSLLPEPKPGQSPSDFLAGKKPKPAKKERAAAMRATPGKDKPRKADEFDGYRVVGSLPTGGSGAKIYVADLDDDKRASLSRTGLEVPGQVVIKCFQLDEGSNLSQIVRESRALESAKRLGMVLEHGLDEKRYFYVMPYVPGEALSRVTSRMHAKANSEGLANKQVTESLGYLADLLVTLDRFHAAGLWHKDVKPDNIIVRDGRAHLVDLGLVTPLGSAMTLTTHGTEYFRDPELVRQALRGAKVHEVDGARFDLYAAGAVLYSMIEDSFPAHGSLSSISKRCPDGVQWIVRRAMADLDSRYTDAAEMLADVRKLQEATDPFAIKPAQLPSMGGRPVINLPEPPPAQALPPRATPAAAMDAPPVPGQGYAPSPDTAAYAEESVNRMPPPVPSKARAHALNAAREAKQALEAVRGARFDARDARKRARKKLADARKKAAQMRAKAANVRSDMRKKTDAFVAKLPKHTRDAIAATAPKPKAKKMSRAERRAAKHEARAAKKARHSGGPTWGGWLALGILLAVGTGAIGVGVATDQYEGYEVAYAEQDGNHTVTISPPSRVISERVSYGPGPGQIVIHRGDESVAEANAPESSFHWGGPLFNNLEVSPAPYSDATRIAEALVSRGQTVNLRPDFPIERRRGRVLLLDQYGELGEDQDQDIKAIRIQLDAQGFEVLDETHDGPEEDAVLNMLAQAKAALGIYGPSDERTADKLLTMLSETPELDAVLWVGPSTDKGRALAYLAVQPYFHNQESLRDQIAQLRKFD